MTIQQNLLIILMEECEETAQRASKAIRFTPEEIQPGQELTNAERIVYEFNDIVAVIKTLYDLGVIKKVFDHEAIKLKQEKIKKYLEYSQTLGTVNK